MAGIEMQNVILIALVVVVALFLAHQYNPYLFSSFGFYEGFEDKQKSKDEKKPKDAHFQDMKKDPFADMEKKKESHFEDMKKDGEEHFADLNAYQGPAQFGAADAPAGCYPRDQLTPSELLPKDQGSVWAEQNPMGTGSLKGKNFLSAGALIGIDTIGNTLRNANLQVRSEPPNPQLNVGPWNNTTIAPDLMRVPLEIGCGGQ